MPLITIAIHDEETGEMLAGDEAKTEEQIIERLPKLMQRYWNEKAMQRISESYFAGVEEI